MRVADLFAGGGGVTEGATSAGLDVVFAANHWAEAVAHHEQRHPGVHHACQDLRQFDFRQVPDHEILWASPACQGHSEAGQPGRARDPSLASKHDHLRTTAWAVVDAAQAKLPPALVVENVPEFREWAFLPEWKSCLRKLGYALTEQVLLASCWGVPQDRRRLIIVGHRGDPIELQQPKVRRGDRPAIGPELDFEAGAWTRIDRIPRAGARRRARHAARTFEGRPCWGQHVSHRGGWARGLDRPANTITTQNQHYLVQGDRYRLWSVEETAAGMGFRRDYFEGVPRTAALKMAGNAVPPPLAAGVLRQVSEAIG